MSNSRERARWVSERSERMVGEGLIGQYLEKNLILS